MPPALSTTFALLLATLVGFLFVGADAAVTCTCTGSSGVCAALTSAVASSDTSDAYINLAGASGSTITLSACSADIGRKLRFYNSDGSTAALTFTTINLQIVTTTAGISLDSSVTLSGSGSKLNIVGGTHSLVTIDGATLSSGAAVSITGSHFGTSSSGVLITGAARLSGGSKVFVSGATFRGVRGLKVDSAVTIASGAQIFITSCDMDVTTVGINMAPNTVSGEGSKLLVEASTVKAYSAAISLGAGTYTDGGTVEIIDVSLEGQSTGFGAEGSKFINGGALSITTSDSTTTIKGRQAFTIGNKALGVGGTLSVTADVLITTFDDSNAAVSLQNSGGHYNFHAAVSTGSVTIQNNVAHTSLEDTGIESFANSFVIDNGALSGDTQKSIKAFTYTASKRYTDSQTIALTGGVIVKGLTQMTFAAVCNGLEVAFTGGMRAVGTVTMTFNDYLADSAIIVSGGARIESDKFLISVLKNAVIDTHFNVTTGGTIVRTLELSLNGGMRTSMIAVTEGATIGSISTPKPAANAPADVVYANVSFYLRDSIVQQATFTNVWQQSGIFVEPSPVVDDPGAKRFAGASSYSLSTTIGPASFSALYNTVVLIREATTTGAFAVGVSNYPTTTAAALNTVTFTISNAHIGGPITVGERANAKSFVLTAVDSIFSGVGALRIRPKSQFSDNSQISIADCSISTSQSAIDFANSNIANSEVRFTNLDIKSSDDRGISIVNTPFSYAALIVDEVNITALESAALYISNSSLRLNGRIDVADSRFYGTTGVQILEGTLAAGGTLRLLNSKLSSTLNTGVALTVRPEGAAYRIIVDTSNGHIDAICLIKPLTYGDSYVIVNGVKNPAAGYDGCPTNTPTFAYISDPFSVEAQLATVILSSPCATYTDQGLTRVSRYILSPFTDYGAGIVGIAHFLIVVGIFCAHVSLMVYLRLMYGNAKGYGRKKFFAEWWSQTLFPTVPFVCGLYVFPGSVVAVFDIWRDGARDIVDGLSVVFTFLLAGVLVACLTVTMWRLKTHSNKWKHEGTYTHSYAAMTSGFDTIKVGGGGAAVSSFENTVAAALGPSTRNGTPNEYADVVKPGGVIGAGAEAAVDSHIPQYPSKDYGPIIGVDGHADNNNNSEDVPPAFPNPTHVVNVTGGGGGASAGAPASVTPSHRASQVSVHPTFLNDAVNATNNVTQSGDSSNNMMSNQHYDGNGKNRRSLATTSVVMFPPAKTYSTVTTRLERAATASEGEGEDNGGNEASTALKNVKIMKSDKGMLSPASSSNQSIGAHHRSNGEPTMYSRIFDPKHEHAMPLLLERPFAAVTAFITMDGGPDGEGTSISAIVRATTPLLSMSLTSIVIAVVVGWSFKSCGDYDYGAAAVVFIYAFFIIVFRPYRTTVTDLCAFVSLVLVGVLLIVNGYESVNAEVDNGVDSFAWRSKVGILVALMLFTWIRRVHTVYVFVKVARAASAKMAGALKDDDFDSDEDREAYRSEQKYIIDKRREDEEHEREMEAMREQQRLEQQQREMEEQHQRMILQQQQQQQYRPGGSLPPPSRAQSAGVRSQQYSHYRPPQGAHDNGRWDAHMNHLDADQNDEVVEDDFAAAAADQQQQQEQAADPTPANINTALGGATAADLSDNDGGGGPLALGITGGYSMSHGDKSEDARDPLNNTVADHNQQAPPADGDDSEGPVGNLSPDARTISGATTPGRHAVSAAAFAAGGGSSHVVATAVPTAPATIAPATTADIIATTTTVDEAKGHVSPIVSVGSPPRPVVKTHLPGAPSPDTATATNNAQTPPMTPERKPLKAQFAGAAALTYGGGDDDEDDEDVMMPAAAAGPPVDEDDGGMDNGRQVSGKFL